MQSTTPFFSSLDSCQIMLDITLSMPPANRVSKDSTVYPVSSMPALPWLRIRDGNRSGYYRSVSHRFALARELIPIGSDPLETEWVPISGRFEWISVSVYIGNGQIKSRYNGIGSIRGSNTDRLYRFLCVYLSAW